MMGELNYFLGLQVKQMNHETFLHQTKYCNELLKKFDMDKSKEAATLMPTNCYLSANDKGKPIDQKKKRGIDKRQIYQISICILWCLFGILVNFRPCFESN